MLHSSTRVYLTMRLSVCCFQNMYASQPESTAGTVAYIAPEVLISKRDSVKYKVR